VDTEIITEELLHTTEVLIEEDLLVEEEALVAAEVEVLDTIVKITSLTKQQSPVILAGLCLFLWKQDLVQWNKIFQSSVQAQWAMVLHTYLHNMILK
jgi:hypothetical protein